MKYLSVHSLLRVSISGFKDQSDADGATFSLVRNDNQKKILDQSSQKVRKTGTLKPVTWELTLDDDIIKDALTDDEMQCKVSVSVTAGGKTWTPAGQNYVLYRNKLTVTARDKDGGTIAGARCTCTIKVQPDFFSKTKRVPHTVATKEDGTAELFLDAPGDLNIEWHFPYYPQDNAAWTSAKGAKREVTLLERERKARFIQPDVSKGEEQKHYMNLSRKLPIEVRIKDGLEGDKIYLTVELTSDKTTGADGEPVKCIIDGDLEVGSPKKTVTFTLDDDGATARIDLDFKDNGGITARLGVSTVEGSTDQSIEVTSWRKVDIQPYHPVRGFFKNDKFPEPLAKKVIDAFAPDFIEIEFLPSRRLGLAFPEIVEPGKFEIVSMTHIHAQACGFDVAGRSGEGALVYFKIGKFVAASPVDWIVGRDERYAHVYRTNPQTALHAVFAHGSYEPREVRVSLILDGENLVSEPQSSTMALTASNIDFNENEEHRGTLILPWNSSSGSHWEVVGEGTRGDVTMAFIEVDREKIKEQQYEFKLKLPDGAPGHPRKRALDGEKIRMKVNLRGYQYSEPSGSAPPLFYLALDPDYTSDESAGRLISEIKGALGCVIGGGR